MKKLQVTKRIGSALLGAAMMLSFMPSVPTALPAYAADDLIVNDCFWKDTNGNNIYSQGGGIFQFGDTYYWYGVHYKGAETYAANPTKKNEDTGFVSVTCYSSKDLVNWKFENDILTPNSKGFGFCYWAGRLGVAYCPKSKQYVLVMQYNESVLFASASSPTGNFEVKNVQDQIQNVQKQGTGDQTIFVDDDGQAYLICSNKGGRGHQYVAKLRESDYLAAEPAVEVAKGSGREGNCMFKYKGKYYFCASDLHGWNASHSYYMVADNIYGPYSGWGVMDGTDADFSHVTQTGFFYTIKGTEQETVLFCGDRWSDFAGNGLGYNQWVPLTVDGSKVKFNSVSEFHLNSQTGAWSIGENNNWILNPTFEADRVSQSTLAGWKNSGDGNGNAKGARTGNFCAQHWSDKDFKGTLSQNVTLPNGSYTLKVYAQSSGSINSSYVYVKGYGGEDKSVSIKDAGNSWKEITIPDIQVTNGKCEVGFSTDAKAGAWVKVDDFTLIGKSEPEAPPEPLQGQIVRDLNILDTAHYKGWSIESGLNTGDAIFSDRAFTIVQMPDSLTGAEWIRPACDSKKYTGDQASFTVAEDATVFLAVDSRFASADWLSGWTKTTDTIVDDGAPVVTYEIWRKDVKPSENVVIGMNGKSGTVNFFAAVKPYEAAPKPTTEAVTELVTEAPTEPVTQSTTEALTEPQTDPATETVIVPQKVRGDANADGTCDVLDLVMLQKWLLGMGTLTDPQAADLNADGCTDVFDLALLKRELLQ